MEYNKNNENIKKLYHLSKETIDHFNIKIDTILENLSFDNSEDKIFNEKVLNSKKSNNIIYVVGTKLEVATLHHMGKSSICLIKDNIHHLMDKMKGLKKQPILLFDDTFINENDKDIIKSLEQNTIKFSFIKLKEKPTAEINESYFIRLNDYLINENDFKDSLKKIEQNYKLYMNKDKQKEFFEKYQDNSYYRDEFSEIQNDKEKKYVATGFEELDNVLSGGLHNERLYILGARTGAGKTTFILQIADYIANQGRCVLFFSLEMSRFELISKSISRLTYTIDKDCAMYTNSFDKRFNSFQHDEVYKKAESQYFNIKKMTIVEASGEIGALQIKKIIEDYINYKQERPVVIVDYLQILAPYEEKYARDIRLNIDKTVVELKRIARRFKIPVVAISSFNRAANRSEEISEDAFKESGAIEYSCDVALGLQSKDKEKSTTREIELKILKNRIGVKNKKITFEYNAGFHHFKEIKETEKRERRTI